MARQSCNIKLLLHSYHLKRSSISVNIHLSALISTTLLPCFRVKTDIRICCILPFGTLLLEVKFAGMLLIIITSALNRFIKYLMIQRRILLAKMLSHCARLIAAFCQSCPHPRSKQIAADFLL